jgi:hypothetical protein
MLAAALLVAAVYLPGIHGGFAFDDYPNIVGNTSLHTGEGWSDWLAAALSSPARDLPRPLAMLSLAIDLRLGGGDPLWFKLVNIAIHLGNFGLCYLLAVRLFARGFPDRDPKWPALLASGAWALHPVNATAVLYVVQRMESLSHLFVFAGLWGYCRIRERQQSTDGGWWRLYATILACTVAGVGAKESAVLLPLYALWLEVCLFRFQGPGSKKRLQLFYVLVLVLPALVGLAWLLPKYLAPAAYAARDFDVVQRMLTECRVLFLYLRWILLPDVAQLSFYHDDIMVSRGLLAPPTTIAAIAGLMGVACMAVFSCRRWPLVALGIGWFLCAHLLTATFLPLEIAFEHRNYFASFGVCLAFVAALLPVASRPQVRAWTRVAAVGLVGCLALQTHLRAREWSDPVSFATSEAAKHPSSPRATYFMGWMLSNATGFRSDSPMYRPAIDALENARSLPDAGVLPDQALLILASRAGQPLEERWWRHLQANLRERAVGAQESSAIAALTTCHVSKACRFPPDEMMATYAAALSHGDDPMVLNSYANFALNELDDVDLALRLWRESKALNPREPQYRISLAKLFIATGHYDEARAEIAGIRTMGKLGQYRREAEALELRLGQSGGRP